MLEDAIDGLIELLNRTDFDAVNELDKSIDIQKPLQEQHVPSVELMVKLNGYMQHIAESSVQQVKMARKRAPHETDLLKNNVRVFSHQYAELIPPTASLADETRMCKVLSELSTLNEVQKRILSVIELQNCSKSHANPPEQTEETRAQLAFTYTNTPDAAKYSGSSSNSNRFIDYMKIDVSRITKTNI